MRVNMEGTGFEDGDEGLGMGTGGRGGNGRERLSGNEAVDEMVEDKEMKSLMPRATTTSLFFRSPSSGCETPSHLPPTSPVFFLGDLVSHTAR